MLAGFYEHEAACAACILPVVVGAWAIAYMLLSFRRSVLPNVRRKDGQFILAPRSAINNIWRYIGHTHIAIGAFTVSAVVPTIWTEPAAPPLNIASYLIAAASLLLTVPVIFRHSNRQRVQAFLGRLGTRGEANAAAAVACMVGGREIKEVLALARRTFRVLPSSALTSQDFAAGNADTGLHEKTRKANLGDCDLFLSHSWSDDAALKWAALTSHIERYTAAHGGAEALLWLDKACINQASIEENLAVCCPSSSPLPSSTLP